MNTKTCTGCKQTKPTTEFSTTGKGGKYLRSRCKPCNAEYARNWNNTNKERAVETKRRRELPLLYGITYEQYEDMHDAQQGVCALCGQKETSTHSTGTPFRLAVDHCHTTGRVRGLLCQNCNRAIGLLKDNPVLLRKAADYIEKD